VDIRSNDEIGELAVRFREMQSGLKRLQQLALQDRELEIAASIQRNLLQRSIPHVRGVEVFPLQRQANLVGGDWYDVDATGRSLSVVVGDASGKGIGAALMATVALSALRSERARGADPKQILASANQALREATDAESFTTLIYAQVDGQTGEVRWMNMGHHPPFLIRPTGPAGARGFYLEGPRNRALGWFEDPGLAETVVSLQPGDRLVLFTDGFLEAKSADGEVFGEHRLAEAMTRLAEVPADALGALVVESVESFAAGKLDDDLTILVVEFQGAEAPGGATEQGSGDESWHSRR
jgi:sigma-B regulation protein RsbU (phosphoserine phosphatase)